MAGGVGEFASTVQFPLRSSSQPATATAPNGTAPAATAPAASNVTLLPNITTNTPKPQAAATPSPPSDAEGALIDVMVPNATLPAITAAANASKVPALNATGSPAAAKPVTVVAGPAAALQQEVVELLLRLPTDEQAAKPAAGTAPPAAKPAVPRKIVAGGAP